MSVQREKSKQLGMNHSTASSRLKKNLLWSYVVKCGDDVCFQCGEKINSVDDLSVEHKKPWLHSENPLELFFDEDNIAFSHLVCNVASARKDGQRKYFTEAERKSALKASRKKYAEKVCPDTGLTNRQKRYRLTGQ